MDPKELLLSRDFPDLSFEDWGNDDLHLIMENFSKANLKILDVLRDRAEAEPEREEEEEEEEEVPLTAAMPTGLYPMTGGVDENNDYVLNITVSKNKDQDWHRGNAWIKQKFLDAFFERLDLFDVSEIVATTKIMGVKAYFDLEGGRKKFKTTETNPIYHFTLKFFFDWLATRPAVGNLNSQLRMASATGPQPKKPGKRIALNVDGYFRSPRLEQYLVVDMEKNPYPVAEKKAWRKTEAKLRDKDESYWKENIAGFEKDGIEYPDPKYFRAEEEVRAATIGRAKILEF